MKKSAHDYLTHTEPHLYFTPPGKYDKIPLVLRRRQITELLEL